MNPSEVPSPVLQAEAGATEPRQVFVSGEWHYADEPVDENEPWTTWGDLDHAFALAAARPPSEADLWCQRVARQALRLIAFREFVAQLLPHRLARRTTSRARGSFRPRRRRTTSASGASSGSDSDGPGGDGPGSPVGVRAATSGPSSPRACRTPGCTARREKDDFLGRCWTCRADDLAAERERIADECWALSAAAARGGAR
jgi:hypothetical protein